MGGSKINEARPWRDSQPRGRWGSLASDLAAALSLKVDWLFQGGSQTRHLKQEQGFTKEKNPKIGWSQTQTLFYPCWPRNYLALRQGMS